MTQADSKATLGDYVDTTSHIVSILGSSAQAALTIGTPALSVINLIATFYPPAAPVAAALDIAMPVLKQLAAHAPEIAKGLEQNKPLIQAVADVGGAALQPLHDLFAQAHGKTAASVHELEHFVTAGPVGDVWRNSYFSPQDPRFNRDDPSSH